jgi:hypothetical protein
MTNSDGRQGAKISGAKIAFPEIGGVILRDSEKQVDYWRLKTERLLPQKPEIYMQGTKPMRRREFITLLGSAAACADLMRGIRARERAVILPKLEAAVAEGRMSAAVAVEEIAAKLKI